MGRTLGDPAWTAWSLRNVGMQAFLMGETEVAQRGMEDALAVFRRGGYRFGAAFVQTNLAEVALRREYARAAALWRELLGQFWAVSILPTVSMEWVRSPVHAGSRNGPRACWERRTAIGSGLANPLRRERFRNSSEW